MEITVFNKENSPSQNEKSQIVNFLYTHLEEYGDKAQDIAKAINYALEEFQSFGGMVLTARIEDNMVGAAVLNRTGMNGYIPENILVYLAAHNQYRGKGIGKNLMGKAIELSEGDIALHVEANNPAKHLYEKMGFSNPYLEMRLKK